MNLTPTKEDTEKMKVMKKIMSDTEVQPLLWSKIYLQRSHTYKKGLGLPPFVFTIPHILH